MMTLEDIPLVSAYSILDLVNPGEMVCEVGVRSGQSSYAFLYKGCFVYLVDPWMEYDEYTENKGYNFEQDYQEVLKMVKQFPNQYKILREKSDDAHRYIPNILSLVYIDGNHAYEFVKNDMNNYWPKVRSGGWLTGDDISMSDIMRAVVEFYFEQSKQHENLKLEYFRRNWGIRKP